MLLLSTAFVFLISAAAVRASQGGYPGGFSERSYGMFYGGQGSDEFGGTEAEVCLIPIMRGLMVSPLKKYYQDGETIEISCEEGYELKPSRRNSTCRVFDVFGRYGVFMPAVTPSTCRELPVCKPPRHYGVVVSPRKAFYEIGETITVSCDEGYDQIGEKILTCEESRDRYWEYKSASFGVDHRRICTEIRDCPVPIQIGLSVKPFKTMYKPGEKIVLSCDDGYDLATSNISACQKSGQFDFGRMSNSGAQDNIWQIDHFILTSSVCRKKARCSPPDFPGLIVSPMKNSYAAGEEISLSCDEKYEMKSPKKSTCGYKAYADNHAFFGMIDVTSPEGQFKPEVRFSTCVLKSRCFAARTKGVIITPAKESYTEGETINISCADGYELIGSASSTCTRESRELAFQQSFFMPDIRNACEKKETCKAPRSRGVVLIPKKKVYDVGETVTILCTSGYELKQANQTVCGRRDEKGNFKQGSKPKFFPHVTNGACEKFPSCKKPKFDGLVVTPDSNLYKIGEKVTLSCQDGYELRVAPSSTCMRIGAARGEFDPNLVEEPCRKLTSCMIPGDKNLVVSPSKESYAEGEKITLSCQEDYSLVASESMTCERARVCRGQKGRVSGCFHPVAPKVLCKKKKMTCDAPKKQPGLVLTPRKDKYNLGETVKISCRKGYELAGEASAKCTSQTSEIKFSVEKKEEQLVYTPPINKPACRKLKAIKDKVEPTGSKTSKEEAKPSTPPTKSPEKTGSSDPSTDAQTATSSVTTPMPTENDTEGR